MKVFDFYKCKKCQNTKELRRDPQEKVYCEECGEERIKILGRPSFNIEPAVSNGLKGKVFNA